MAPRLEINLYRQRFRALASGNASVMAQALARVKSNPLLIWMLLSQNADLVSSHVGVNSVGGDTCR